MKSLDREYIENLATGAAILGTGGGGDPYLGKLTAFQALEDGYDINLIDVKEIPNDALIVPSAGMGSPNRVAEGQICLFDRKLGSNQHFSYKVEMGYDKKSVDRILDIIFQLTNEPVRELEKFSVDGSGSPTSVKQNYAEDRQSQRQKDRSKTKTKSEPKSDDNWLASSDPKHDYVCKVAAIGTKYKLFAGWILCRPFFRRDHFIPRLWLRPF